MRQWLYQARKAKNMTHEDVAKKANISRQYYGLIENGDRGVSVHVAKKIASVLDFDWTIFFEENSNVS